MQTSNLAGGDGKEVSFPPAHRIPGKRGLCYKILATLVGTVVIFSDPSMLVFACCHHRSKKFNIGREGAQRFVAIPELQGVSQLKGTQPADAHGHQIPFLGRVTRETESEKCIRNTLNKPCRVELVTSRNRDYRP